MCMLLDCPHEHLVSLRTKLACLPTSVACLKTLLNRPDVSGVASFVLQSAHTLAFCLAPFVVWLQVALLA